ncbi:ArsR family transcriptional regulator [Paenibacillus swuensis]|uniref:ArsR family transcriptional regulator n=1 Tax=Paenibacillus swuensis TaxID=1178515 RepID=A0A172TIT0_9BACL|nr:metalloregulator ArsR/SmtB family transcription factor [Paenibacillus swuensis]ANE46866.1 ArsR family transcriptional regulator [Paenibacillus swuensis]
MNNEDKQAAIKAISNETRFKILCWLREPETNFGAQVMHAEFPSGVCVGSIQEKSGLTQSVISSYLTSMQKAGLLESRRFGQWTYYRRNEKGIDSLLNELNANLKGKD